MDFVGRGDFNGDCIDDMLVKNFETGEMQMILFKAPEEESIVGSASKILETITIDGTAYSNKDFDFVGVGDFNAD